MFHFENFTSIDPDVHRTFSTTRPEKILDEENPLLEPEHAAARLYGQTNTTTRRLRIGKQTRWSDDYVFRSKQEQRAECV